MKFFSPRVVAKADLKLIVLNGLQDGELPLHGKDSFSIGGHPGVDFLLVDCDPQSIFSFKRIESGFEIKKNGEVLENLLELDEAFSIGNCSVQISEVLEATQAGELADEDDLHPFSRGWGTSLLRNRTGFASFAGAALMGVALTAALATGVLGESDDQALQSALINHGAKNVFVSKKKEQFLIRAQFENESSKSSFAAWIERRMGKNAVLQADVGPLQVVSSNYVSPPPRALASTPMEAAFGCSKDCFDPASISMIRSGKVPRVYLSNGSFLSVGDRIVSGVYIDDVTDGAVTISNGEKTVTLLVE